MAKREFTADMGQISGFGGEYEKVCQAMVLAGLDFLDANPGIDLTEEHLKKCPVCFAKSVVLMGYVVAKAGQGSTKVQQVTCLRVLAWIHEYSWEQYVEHMIAREKAEQERGRV